MFTSLIDAWMIISEDNTRRSSFLYPIIYYHLKVVLCHPKDNPSPSVLFLRLKKRTKQIPVDLPGQTAGRKEGRQKYAVPINQNPNTDN